jgi:hypothetical protein
LCQGTSVEAFAYLFSTGLSGGSTWWARREFIRMNIAQIIRKNQFEENPDFCKSRAFLVRIDRMTTCGRRAVVSGRR